MIEAMYFVFAVPGGPYISNIICFPHVNFSIALSTTYICSFVSSFSFEVCVVCCFLRAISDYGKAITRNPDFLEAYTNRGNSYIELKMPKKAILDFNLVINKDPESKSAYAGRTIANTILGYVKAADHDYLKAIELGIEEEILSNKIQYTLDNY